MHYAKHRVQSELSHSTKNLYQLFSSKNQINWPARSQEDYGILQLGEFCKFVESAY